MIKITPGDVGVNRNDLNGNGCGHIMDTMFMMIPMTDNMM